MSIRILVRLVAVYFLGCDLIEYLLSLKPQARDVRAMFPDFFSHFADLMGTEEDVDLGASSQMQQQKTDVVV